MPELLRKRLASLELKQDGEPGSFVAVIATKDSGPDSDGDIYADGAIGEQDIMILPAHDSGHVPLGKGKTYETDTDIRVDGQFNLAIQSAKDWHESLKFDLANGKPIGEWSYGYIVLDSAEERRDGQYVNLLKNVDVIEGSPVIRGAGNNTRTISAKSKRNGKAIDESKAALARLVSNSVKRTARSMGIEV